MNDLGFMTQFLETKDPSIPAIYADWCEEKGNDPYATLLRYASGSLSGQRQPAQLPHFISSLFPEDRQAFQSWQYTTTLLPRSPSIFTYKGVVRRTEMFGNRQFYTEGYLFNRRRWTYHKDEQGFTPIPPSMKANPWNQEELRTINVKQFKKVQAPEEIIRATFNFIIDQAVRGNNVNF